MKTSIHSQRFNSLLFAVLTSAAAISESTAAITMVTSAAGDAQYAWNSKYGSYGYTTGGTDIGVGLQMGGQYGNDYTIGIFMVPIGDLSGQSVSAASLQIYSNGFGTGYYYGSAGIGWLDTGAMSLTGNVETDGLGGPASGRPGGFTIFNTDVPGSEAAGFITYDVTTQVQADVAAGRSFSTFVLSGSRDTYGSIKAAESGSVYAPQIVATIPEPSSIMTLSLVVLGFSWVRRRR